MSHEQEEVSLHNGIETNEKSKEYIFVNACKEGNVEAVKQLLSTANFQSVYNGIVAAFDNNQRDVAKVILETPEIESIRDRETDESIFLKLQRNRKDIAYQVLDECYNFQDGGKLIHFNFKFLENLRTKHRSEHSFVRIDSVSAMNGEQIRILENMDIDSDLLLHPVVKGLLSWKWTRYIALFYFINLAIYLVYLGFLTGFALQVPNPQLDICTGNGSNNSTNTRCHISSNQRTFLILAASFTTGFGVLRLLMEFFQLLNIPKFLHPVLMRTYYNTIRDGNWAHLIKPNWINWKYFLHPSNYIEIPMYILSMVFVSASYRECLCPNNVQWQAGTIALFLAWIAFLLFVNKWPALGIYLGMFSKILLRFLMITMIFVLLLISFTFSFYMAFYEPALPDTPFQSVLVTFVTMFSFAIGGPSISIFRLTNDDTDVESVPYPFLSYTLWIIFGVVVSVLFLNFLVGLAVDDVQELRKQSDRRQMKSMINLHKQVESLVILMYTFFTLLKCTCCLKLLKKRSPSSRSRTVDCDSYYVKTAFLWGDEIHNIIAQAQKFKSEKGT
jgi:transient receptor potential cation channel subfamily A protein 1